MRRIEAASLLPDLSVQYSTHTVPCNDVFDRITGGMARGTVLATNTGPVAVEDLMPGDFLDTSEGPQPILWIGSANLYPNYHDSPETAANESGRLIRVMAQSFGVARPTQDVLLGPWAALLHNPPQLSQSNGQGHVLTPISDFVDGMNVFRVSPPSAVRVFHIVLRRHAAIDASGLQIESYHPGPGLVDQMGSNAQRLFLSLFGHIEAPRDFGPLTFPRVDQALLDGLSAA